jgi:hypothetical protein
MATGGREKLKQSIRGRWRRKRMKRRRGIKRMKGNRKMG